MKLFVSLLLLLNVLWANGQLTYETLEVLYDSARTFRNLQVVPIRMKATGPGRSHDIMTLSEAIRQGLATISERGTASTENVHWVRVNNKSGKPLFIASGEIISGGRQDRTVSRDTILIPNGRDQYFSTMCVEEGRWSEKEKKFKYSGYANPKLRKVIDQGKNQLLIWKEIYSQLDSSKFRSPTLAYTARRGDKKFQVLWDEYKEFFNEVMFNRDSSIVGVVCISGNKILGADIFDAANLFREESDALMTGYIEEAIIFGSTPEVSDNEIEMFLDKFLTNEKEQEQYCKHNGKIFRYSGRVIHVTAYP